MSAPHLGDATCPLCQCHGARVSLSKKNLAVLTCNSSKCRGMQMFARSADSDELIRNRIGEAAPSPEPAPAASSPAPVRTETAPEPVRTEPPAPVRTEKTDPEPVRTGGLLKHWFDQETA